jgi:hypothetical protein
MKRLAFREDIQAMKKNNASPKRGKYAHKGTHNLYSNIIIVPFCVFIKRIDTRRIYEN